MKSPTYILKRVYDETLQEKDYITHIYTLKNIHDKKSQIIQSTNNISQKYQQHRQNKFNSRKFMESEQEYIRKFENQSLFDKIGGINKQTMLCRAENSKSLIATSQKLEQQRIVQENLRLAKRMIELPSVINKVKLETDYNHHLKDGQIMKRYHQQMGEKNKELRDIITFHGIKKRLREGEQCKSITQTRTQSQSEAYHSEWKTYEEPIYIVQIQFQQVMFNKELPKKDNKIESLYLIEGKLLDKELFRTKPQNYESFQHHIIKMQLTPKQYKQVTTIPRSCEILVWKLKNYTEINMGSFYLDEEDFDMVPDFPILTIEGSIQGSTKKLPDSPSSLGKKKTSQTWEQIQIKNLKKDIIKMICQKELWNGVINYTMTVKNLKNKP